ncbi:MAG: D-alanyl-D-alanine carboxypeptidase/D-alanyl-D-alanine-endopeptidase [Longimicrobiales bacterium]|nr:D-alanyl-D-alanine carboxypeptidase/D-alanyl-D-alanine-endopeptidase [Longimicrobiales bacterium]
MTPGAGRGAAAPRWRSASWSGRRFARPGRALLLLLALGFQGCASAGGGAPGGTRPPVAVLDSVLDAAPMDQLHWGVLVLDAGSGAVVFERNARRRFVPASNAKLLVTAAALLELGPEYRFGTEAWIAGALDPAGVVRGDLVIPAVGDPTLSRRYWGDDEAPLRALVDSLRDRGLRGVAGRLVVDVSAWDTVPAPASWMIGNLPWGFSALPAPFAIAEGTTWVVVEGGAVAGEAARTHWYPLGTEGFVEGDVRTVAEDDSTAEVGTTWRAEEGRHILWGSIPAGAVDTLPLSTRVPTREAGRRLLQLMDSAGIPVQGGFAVVPDSGVSLGGGCRTGALRGCARAERLARLESPPLSEVVRGILEPSQNWMTEQLIGALALARGLPAGRQHGLDLVEEVLIREAGLDSLDVDLRDGSGLSAYNLVTPRALVAVLRRMAGGPLAETYREALAAPGEADSTLEERLLDLRGRVQAKTGTISNVNSLSGYLVADSGRELIFSILSNGAGLPAGQVRERIDDVARALARGY